MKPVDIRSHSVRLPMRLLHSFMHTRPAFAGNEGLSTATFSIQQITATGVMEMLVEKVREEPPGPLGFLDATG